MKKRSKSVYALIIGILFFTISIIPKTSFSQTVQQKEGRAVWLHSSIFEDEKEEATQHLKELLDQYAEIGINNIFCFYTMKDQNQKEWDFLEILLEKAHEKGMKVHPIICPGQRVKSEGEIEEHPEWLIRDKKGEIVPNLNLANPEVREYIKEKVTEALKYDIDGIHLDYIRFQINQGFSYDKATCEAFKKEFGYSPLDVHQDCGSIIWCEWIKWNAKQVTTLVREIKEIVDRSGKDVVLGVDVFPDSETAKVLIGQDWELWAREGLVDMICPMQYTNDLDVFRRSVKRAVKTTDGKCLIYPGIACHSSHNKNTPEGVIQEVIVAREEGADGVTFFSGTSLTDEFIDKLKMSVFQTINSESLWNKKYDFIYDFPPILFHYHHGIFAGSYPPDQETTEISFNDVSCYLGHVCLCGAGGYRISQIATDLIKGPGKSLERDEFTLISSRDHTVSDVIAYVLGCSRRNDIELNHYFIDETINAPQRVYHYYIGYHPLKKAVHIVYNKHLLIGNERMDKLWKVELAFDKDPDSVNQADVKLYQDTMFDVVEQVLLDQKKGLFEVESIEYDEFISRINKLK